MILVLVLLSFAVCTVSTALLVLLTWCFCASELFTKYIIKDSDAGRSNWSGFLLPGKLVSSDEHMSALSAGPHKRCEIWILPVAVYARRLCNLLNFACLTLLTYQTCGMRKQHLLTDICSCTFLRHFFSLPGACVTFLMHLKNEQPSCAPSSTCSVF